MLYLDNAATTQPLESSIQLMQSILQNQWGNPSSLHRLGVQAADILEQARFRLAQNWSISAEEIIWTSGATEANQTILLQAPGNPNSRKNHILVSPFEHPSVTKALPILKANGFEIEYLAINLKGHINAKDLASKLRPETALVSVIGVHNELGVKQDIDHLSQIIRNTNPKTRFHVDAVQWINKYPFPSGPYRPDFITFSAHKCHGPKGIGGIVKRKEVPLTPLLQGGQQEHGFRAGTENIAGIVASVESLLKMNAKIDHSWAQSIEQTLHSYVNAHPDLVWVSPPPGPHKSPWIHMISAPKHKSEVLIHRLEDKGIFISSGSACSEKKKERKVYVDLMKLSPTIEQGLLRISLSSSNQTDDMQVLITSLGDIL